MKLEFKNNIRKTRNSIGLTQEELANIVGVSRQTISAIENGQFNPTAKLALLLCYALDKTFEELFFLKEK